MISLLLYIGICATLGVMVYSRQIKINRTNCEDEIKDFVSQRDFSLIGLIVVVVGPIVIYLLGGMFLLLLHLLGAEISFGI